MIQIENKRDCDGCGACYDACGKYKAITFKVDNEGFWYPEVDKNLCVDCHQCEKVCPELNAEKAHQTNTMTPICFGAHHKDRDIRLDSTSGGLFSALANKMYAQGGFVAGAVYNEDFSVKHIVSSDENDLSRIRSSKYLQSQCFHLYKNIKNLLVKGERVLVCGCPCQMAALRLFIEKDYENLIICDFICKGINSPKIFRKHLDALEKKYKSKIVYAKAKNKELGWRALTFKAVFENRKSYYGPLETDDFTRGYLRTGIYCRPSCYDCKYKKIPRVADITLADFWGIENVEPALDDNTGTSLVICNSEKGLKYFDSIKEMIVYKQVDFDSVKPGNKHLLYPLEMPPLNRKYFFNLIDKLPFDKVAQMMFPRNTFKTKILKALKNMIVPFYHMGLHPVCWYQFLWLNLFRRNSDCDILRGNIILPLSHCVFDIDPKAKISVKGRLTIGFKVVKGSRLETRLKMGQGTGLKVQDNFYIYSGADIQLMRAGELTIDGGPGSGCNINCQIVCAENIHIGRSTLIGRNVVIRDFDAHYIMQKGYRISAPVDIGTNCWIGEGVMISKGVNVGEGAVVAARSWVISKVKPQTLVAGNPAVVVETEIEWKQ